MDVEIFFFFFEASKFKKKNKKRERSLEENWTFQALYIKLDNVLLYCHLSENRRNVSDFSLPVLKKKLYIYIKLIVHQISRHYCHLSKKRILVFFLIWKNRRNVAEISDFSFSRNFEV